MFLFSWDQIDENLLESHSKMPSSCCVPDYSKKGYRDEDGSKVSFYQFPEEVKWMHAIRRDEGERFHITQGTRFV